MKQFDVVIIGSGPGGYVCAIRCAQLGLKTAIVERYPTLGGTCLNVGCIPSKAILNSADRYHEIAHAFESHGIEVENYKLNFGTTIKRVQDVVDQTCSGVEFLMKKNKIEVLHGHASFLNEKEIEVKGETTENIAAKHFVIATGSKPSTLPGIEIDKKSVISSTEALKLKKIPKSMILIGGGIIGVELGSVYNRFGSEVTCVEFADRIIPSMDMDCSKELTRVLKKEKMKFALSHAVKSVEITGSGVVVHAEKQSDRSEVQFEAEICLVGVGRKPYTDGLGLENLSLETDERGRIPTNDQLQTKHSHIYAIGDVTTGAMLAHKAEEEGVLVAEVIVGQKPHINYNLIPSVVYTSPEVAGVGKTEQDLKKENQEYKKGSFPIRALGRARASGEIEGMVKVLADKNTDEILGVHMVGARAADMIAEAVVAMEFRASAEDVARMSHAHPTFTEAMKEACLAATEDRALHI